MPDAAGGTHILIDCGLNLREKAALSPIAVAALVMGVAPLLWLNAIDPAVQVALAPLAQLASRVVGR